MSESLQEPEQFGEAPTCIICGRKRTIGTPDHRMDAYDYSPFQVITNQPLGWYSGKDGEICPEDFTQILRNQ